MKKVIVLFALVLSVATSVIAQTSVWKVTGKGSTMYLGGTIHLLRASDFPLPAQFDSAYAHSSAIAFETDMDELQKPENTQKMMSMMMLTNGKTLKSVISEPAYKALEKLCAGVGLPIANLGQFKPSMVVLMATALKLQQLGFSTDGVDRTYLTKAKNDGKKLLFLETIDQQINYIANLSTGKEDELIKQSLDDLEKTEKEFPELVKAWRAGSDNAMSKSAEEMKKEYPDMYKSLLVERNNNWLPVIESYLATPETEFVLVGSLHLFTNDGIVKVLKDKGYKVEQM
jgi:uncharacterized protein YbaP (TraB family)